MHRICYLFYNLFIVIPCCIGIFVLAIKWKPQMEELKLSN
jgi:hypothetical protein